MISDSDSDTDGSGEEDEEDGEELEVRMLLFIVIGNIIVEFLCSLYYGKYQGEELEVRE